MTTRIPQVGAPDPERNTSPIFIEDEDPNPEVEMDNAVCYFNDVPFALGDSVRSGDEVLRCEEGAVWVRQGEMRTDVERE